MIYVLARFVCLNLGSLSYIYSFLDDMSSVKLPVDFVGQEAGMGFASKNTISSFFNGFQI